MSMAMMTFQRSIAVALLAFFLFALFANAAPVPVSPQTQQYINEIIPYCNECFSICMAAAGLDQNEIDICVAWKPTCVNLLSTFQ